MPPKKTETKAPVSRKRKLAEVSELDTITKTSTGNKRVKLNTKTRAKSASSKTDQSRSRSLKPSKAVNRS